MPVAGARWPTFTRCQDNGIDRCNRRLCCFGNVQEQSNRARKRCRICATTLATHLAKCRFESALPSCELAHRR